MGARGDLAPGSVEGISEEEHGTRSMFLPGVVVVQWTRAFKRGGRGGGGAGAMPLCGGPGV